jgi:lipoate---protein ligase
MLRFIKRPETDPYYNLAAEEYFMKTSTVDTFMIWRNEPSVIIGKHQNAFREINHSFIEKNNLPVIRRITGGGTVYHDPGNINFSFIFTNRKENLIDFREFTQPVIQFLQDLGLNASFEGKNNITVDGLKVSGNSAHLYKNKVLYHGTLLFNSDLEMLEQAIEGREELYKDKAVRSIRSKVANVNGLLKEKISEDEFIRIFQDFIFNYFNDVEEDVHPENYEAIQKLAEEKYKSYRWNFGYSPDYEYNKRWSSGQFDYSIRFIVKEGIISHAEITGPELDCRFLSSIAELLSGVQHERKSVSEKVKTLTFLDERQRNVVNQIIDHLF